MTLAGNGRSAAGTSQGTESGALSRTKFSSVIRQKNGMLAPRHFSFAPQRKGVEFSLMITLIVCTAAAWEMGVGENMRRDRF